MSNYSKTYRVGLVGSGGIARAHGTACQALDGADLSAICDVSQEALDRYGEQFGVTNRYLDLDDMLEDANDFVRQAILAEMEKSFVAYEKELFLHIGAKYIDQRANADVNDDNFMETFVRVFGKF